VWIGEDEMPAGLPQTVCMQWPYARRAPLLFSVRTWATYVVCTVRRTPIVVVGPPPGRVFCLLTQQSS